MITNNIQTLPARSSAPTFYTSITGAHEVIGMDNNGTDASDSMTEQTFLFLVEDGFTATVNASMGVDDWGFLKIEDTDGEKLMLGMRSGTDAKPGPRGGHEYWEKSGSVTLLAGTYTITVHHENVTYSDEYDSKYNDSKCNFSITAVKKALPKVLNSQAFVKVQCGVSPLKLERKISLTAEVQGEGTNKQIVNLKIGEYDASPVVFPLEEGGIAKIEILSVTAAFEGDTVVDSVTNTVSRKARLFWSARIQDPLHTESPNRVVKWHTGLCEGSIASPDAVFSTSVD